MNINLNKQKLLMSIKMKIRKEKRFKNQSLHKQIYRMRKQIMNQK